MNRLCLLMAIFGMIWTQTAYAAWPGDWYVATNGTGQGTNGWADATNNLQGAITACASGKTVLVSNGVYQTGGTVAGSMTNRVHISKAITVRSANNDPTNTTIKGAWHPVTTNGTAAIRCVYMVANATLSGFTLTNGATIAGGNGGGVYSDSATATISNCVITGCSADGNGGGARQGTLFGCKLISNRAVSYGGGSSAATISNCTVMFNYSQQYGGGVHGAYDGSWRIIYNTYNSTIVSNFAYNGGGGAREMNIFNSTISYNRSPWNPANMGMGGGASACTFSNCVISYNNAFWGGGTYGCTLYNSLLYGNQASEAGGGYKSSLINCTVVGNNATRAGGVANYDSSITVRNSIIYSNQVSLDYPNWCDLGGVISFANSCTYPTGSTWSAGSTSNNPLFMVFGSGYGLTHVPGDYRLQANSPCVNSGTNQAWMDTAVDRDGHSRIDRFSGRVDMGCYEYLPRGMMFKVR